MSSKNVRTFELKLGKRAVILFVAGMSCLLFVVFLFGVTVGKNIDTYPEKFSRGIPGMFMEKFGWSSNRAETAAPIVEVAKEPVKTEGEEKSIEEKKALVAAPPGTDEKQAIAGAIPEQKSASPPAAEQVKAKQPHGKEKYQIQVVSLKEKEKADVFCKQLKGLGFKPKIAVTELPEKGKWFRVILEGFEDRDQAKKATESIAKKIKGLNCVISKMEEKNNQD